MGPGLLAYDLLYLTLATALYGSASWVAVRAFFFLTTHRLYWPFALVPSGLAFLVVLVSSVAVLTFLCPRLRPGRYPLMKGATFYGWLARSLLRRILMAPGLKWFLFTSNVLRFLTLRALGARVAFSTNMSADVDLLDPCLLTVGAGSVIGARSLLSGHYVDGGMLLLGRITIGEKVLLAADVTVGPGAQVGDRASVKVRAGIGPDARVGAGASIGGDAALDVGAQVGAGADLGVRSYVGRGAVVGDNVKLGPLTHVVAPPPPAGPTLPLDAPP